MLNAYLLFKKLKGGRTHYEFILEALAALLDDDRNHQPLPAVIAQVPRMSGKHFPGPVTATAKKETKKRRSDARCVGGVMHLFEPMSTLVV